MNRASLPGQSKPPRKMRNPTYAAHYERRVKTAVEALRNTSTIVGTGRNALTMMTVLDNHVMNVVKACGYNRSLAADLLGYHRRTLQRQLPRIARRLGVPLPKAKWTLVDSEAATEMRRSGMTWNQISKQLGDDSPPEAIRRAVKRALEAEVHFGLPARAWDGLYEVWQSTEGSFSSFCQHLSMPEMTVHTELELAKERAKLLQKDPPKGRRRPKAD